MTDRLDTVEHSARLVLDKRIGKGSFGSVFRMYDKEDPSKVYALKRVENYASIPGMQVRYARLIVREVLSLKVLQGFPNIVTLHQAYLSEDKEDLYLLMPFIAYDLQSVLTQRALSASEAKWIAYQLLVGIYYTHKEKIMHRDLTLKNVLVSEESDLFIADFGLARGHQTHAEDFTLDVVTLEYRAPELLLQYKKYDTRLDMWSVGCVIAELFLRRRLFEPQPRDVPNALMTQIQGLGMPEVEFVQQFASQPCVAFLNNQFAKTLRKESVIEPPRVAAPPLVVQLAAAGAPGEAIDLIHGLLQFDFRKRLTAAQALRMPWFTNDTSENYAQNPGVLEAISKSTDGRSASKTSSNAAPSSGLRRGAEDDDDDDGNSIMKPVPRSSENMSEEDLNVLVGASQQSSAVGIDELLEFNEELANLRNVNVSGLRKMMESLCSDVPDRVRGTYRSVIQ